MHVFLVIVVVFPSVVDQEENATKEVLNSFLLAKRDHTASITTKDISVILAYKKIQKGSKRIKKEVCLTDH